MQTTSHILMVRPARFAFNAETAVNNAFQTPGDDNLAQRDALNEFDSFVSLLRANDIDVTIVNDTPEPHTPDSLFPNNWISFHEDGTLILYPMYAVNRRLERSPAVINEIDQKFEIKKTIDLTFYEAQNRFLEGTGSMVLDRENRIAYACLSPRTDVQVLTEFCRQLSFHPVIFDSLDAAGSPIYHTNVMMCVTENAVVICLESIPSENQRQAVIDSISTSGKEVVAISMEQLNAFAGNMLQLSDRNQNKILVMSSRAFRSLAPDQLLKLEKSNRIVHAPLDAIETYGGGSARCMIAEVHLPIRK